MSWTNQSARARSPLSNLQTKYECGHYGSEGKVFNTATTQTDKVTRPAKSTSTSHGQGGLIQFKPGSFPGLGYTMQLKCMRKTRI